MNQCQSRGSTACKAQNLQALPVEQPASDGGTDGDADVDHRGIEGERERLGLWRDGDEAGLLRGHEGPAEGAPQADQRGERDRVPVG